MFGSRGQEFLDWLSDPLRQEAGGGYGAFARWAVAAVADGEVRATDLWYPRRLERASSQFPRGDWDDAKAMYISREMRYCSGDGRDEEDGWPESGSRSCWVAGSCSGRCFSDCK
jgi:hypothetical protein